MQKEVEFSSKQDEYKYMKIDDTHARVFIKKFLREEEKENDSEEGGTTTSFYYDMNEFLVDSEKITEEMIKADPLSYLEYNPDDDVVTTEDRIEGLESAIMELANILSEVTTSD